MENGRCRLHGGLTPRIHPNHRAKFNAVKHGRYSASTKMKIRELKAEIYQIDQILIELENNDAFNKKSENEKNRNSISKRLTQG